jgi:hypothetical protein
MLRVPVPAYQESGSQGSEERDVIVGGYDLARGQLMADIVNGVGRVTSRTVAACKLRIGDVIVHDDVRNYEL